MAVDSKAAPLQLIPYCDSYRHKITQMAASFFATEVPFDAEELVDSWQRDQLAVILEAQIPVGFVRLVWHTADTLLLEDLYILPGHRGLGYATTAIECCSEYARELGADALCAKVDARSPDTLRLYRSLGFDGISQVTLRQELKPGGNGKEATTFRDLVFFV